jgi:uncharacterized protein
MSDLNSQHNRVVWVDIPVKDLSRAMRFYAAVLGRPVNLVEMPGMKFAVLDHEQGNGGCLVEKPEEVSSTAGILVYLNADGRIRAAVAEVEQHGGQIVAPVHSLGPHGFRALVHDSEGNRLALHSNTDQ